MELAESLFLTGPLPLFVLSTFSACIFLLVLTAMLIILYSLYRSRMTSYNNKINSLSLQMSAMQQHLEYASREETKARADAKRSAAAREKLLTSLSHEIRTPMNGILGMTILLEETNLNPEQRDYIDTIISSGRILLNKVDQVMADDTLEQSKIDRTLNNAQFKNTDLRNCVEEVMETFAVRASEKLVDLMYEIDADVPLQVMTDNNRLKQVLTNLVENVMENKMQVFVGVHLIKHDSTDTAPTLGFTICEQPPRNSAQLATILATGNVLPEIDPKKEQEIKHLGLTISKKLIGEMNGQIRAINGTDTAYVFSIPLNIVPAAAAPKTYNLKDFEGKPVLLINNNETAAAILKRQLQQWKLRPEVAANTNMAFQMAEERPFSLMIIDMNLQEMNGADLAARMKNAFPEMSIILISTSDDDGFRERAGIPGEVTILKKPVKQHLLFDSILSNQRNKKTGRQDISIRKLSADFSKQYPLRILVAEDNLVNQKWAIKILSKMGYHADIADNGHMVLDMVDRSCYDLILMDVQMPGMDGLEATKMIRLCLNKQPVVIAMTANVMHGDRVACMQAGMDDYISKPVQLGELVNMLEKWALVITEKKLTEQLQ
jgi:CheY-like chemotaxis protein/nitrogen-specific signal transduction histidine kinase